MIFVPTVTGVTTPDPEIVADAFWIAQVPPETPSVNVAGVPIHTVAGPVIVPADGVGITVTVEIAETDPQLAVTVYEIVSTPPETPVTVPPATVASVLAVLHVPPEAPSLSVIDEPSQTL